MIITKDALRIIEEVAHSKEVEIGGILGMKTNNVVSYVITDLPENAVGCRFDYSPNIEFLNTQIENWAENDIQFIGLFHTHFSGSRNLSDADIEYVKEIMMASKGIVEYLYFPLFTLPDNELTVYKACYNGEKIVIRKDTLNVI